MIVLTFVLSQCFIVKLFPFIAIMWLEKSLENRASKLISKLLKPFTSSLEDQAKMMLKACLATRCLVLYIFVK